jgi:hypothetical protein
MLGGPPAKPKKNQTLSLLGHTAFAKSWINASPCEKKL